MKILFCCTDKKTVVISYPRTKALIKDKKSMSSGCSPLPVSAPLTLSPWVSFNDEIVEIPASPIPYELNIEENNVQFAVIIFFCGDHFICGDYLIC